MSRKFSVERLTLAEANEFVAEHHRHHRPVIGHVFSIGAAFAGKIIGIAIVGRPVARGRDDGVTAEVTRLATDGTKDACSFLYGASARRLRTRLQAHRNLHSRQRARHVAVSCGVADDRRGAWPVVVMRLATARRQASDARQAALRGASMKLEIHHYHHQSPATEVPRWLADLHRKLDLINAALAVSIKQEEIIMIDTTKILAAVARERTENASLRALLDAKDKIIADGAAALKAAIDAGGDPVALAKVQADLDQAATELDTDSDAAVAAILANTPPPAPPT